MFFEEGFYYGFEMVIMCLWYFFYMWGGWVIIGWFGDLVCYMLKFDLNVFWLIDSISVLGSWKDYYGYGSIIRG